MRKSTAFSIVGELRHRLWVVLGSAALTLILFLVLPLMQTINKPPTADLVLQTVDTANVPPPPPPPEKETEETVKEEKPPELMETAPPLDLSQLELALNPGFSEGGMGGDFAVKLNLNTVGAEGDNLDALFSMADLDQTPRILYQPGPILNNQVRKKLPARSIFFSSLTRTVVWGIPWCRNRAILSLKHRRWPPLNSGNLNPANGTAKPCGSVCVCPSTSRKDNNYE